MTYLIILIVVALVISPVMWMMPSPQQKRQMRMRQRAMELGLQVKVCDLPQTESAMVRRESAIKGIVYRLLWRPEDKAQVFNHLRLRSADDLPGDSIQSQLNHCLGKMPPSVMAVEYSNLGLAAYWTERGESMRLSL